MALSKTLGKVDIVLQNTTSAADARQLIFQASQPGVFPELIINHGY